MTHVPRFVITGLIEGADRRRGEEKELFGSA